MSYCIESWEIFYRLLLEQFKDIYRSDALAGP